MIKLLKLLDLVIDIPNGAVITDSIAEHAIVVSLRLNSTESGAQSTVNSPEP